MPDMPQMPGLVMPELLRPAMPDVAVATPDVARQAPKAEGQKPAAPTLDPVRLLVEPILAKAPKEAQPLLGALTRQLFPGQPKAAKPTGQQADEPSSNPWQLPQAAVAPAPSFTAQPIPPMPVQAAPTPGTGTGGAVDNSNVTINLTINATAGTDADALANLMEHRLRDLLRQMVGGSRTALYD
jgi:hypothetical protein